MPDVERRRWHTVTGPLAFCTHCPDDGSAHYHGDGDKTARAAFAWAQRHAKATGHEVIVERGQSMVVRPIAGGSNEA